MNKNSESDESLIFYLSFEKDFKTIKTSPESIDLPSLFNSSYPISDIPKSAISFEIKDKKFGVTHLIDDPKDIYPNAIVSAKIMKECVPLDVLLGKFDDSVQITKMNYQKTVKLKGLPWECDEIEVRSFFDGLEIIENGVKIVFLGSNNRKHSGEAFVEFKEESSVNKALEKNGEKIFERYIEVYKTNSEELFKYLKRDFETKQNEGMEVPVDKDSIILKLSGLPWEASYSDVINFLIDVPITAVHFTKDKLGRATGTAFIEVADFEFAARAIGHSKEFIGKRFIEVHLSSMKTLIKKMEIPEHISLETKENEKTYCVLIQNLTPTTNNFEIDNFFSLEAISPFRIHKKINGTDAFCEFTKHSDYLKALTTDGKELGGNRIIVQHIDFDKVAKVVGFIKP